MTLALPPQRKDLEVWQEADAKPYIKIENICKSYGKINTLKGISLSIYKGELFSLLGQSGCGKTTLLRILAGLENPDVGSVFIDDIDITNFSAHIRPVSIMFQSYALFPHMNVYQNIAFGLKQDGLSKLTIDNRINEVLDLVKLSEFKNKKTNELSGGQKQRIALARSLAKRPKLLLLDEPLAALDENLRKQTQFELVNIQERVGITFILVTHDQEEAMTMSTRIAVMDNGKIKQIGPPRDIYEFPNSRYVAEFIGDTNFFEGFVVEQEFNSILVESEEIDCPCYASYTGALPIGSKVILSIRPEKIMMSTLRPAYPRNWILGVIKDIAYLGDVSIYYVQGASGKIVRAMLPNLLRLSDRNYKWEDKVYLFWRSENSAVLTA